MKSKKLVDTVDLADEKKEAQEELEMIVGEAANKHKGEKTQNANAASFQVSVPQAVGVGVGGATGLTTTNETTGSFSEGNVTVGEELNQTRLMQQEKFRQSSIVTSVSKIYHASEMITHVF